MKSNIWKVLQIMKSFLADVSPGEWPGPGGSHWSHWRAQEESPHSLLIRWTLIHLKSKPAGTAPVSFYILWSSKFPFQPSLRVSCANCTVNSEPTVCCFPIWLKLLTTFTLTFNLSYYVYFLLEPTLNLIVLSEPSLYGSTSNLFSPYTFTFSFHFYFPLKPSLTLILP